MHCSIIYVQAIGYNVIILCVKERTLDNYYASKYNYSQLDKLIIMRPDSGNPDWCA